MKYYFRALPLIEYDKNTKELIFPKTDGICNVQMCKFIPEDYMLLGRFFTTIGLHAKGAIGDELLKNIEVD